MKQSTAKMARIKITLLLVLLPILSNASDKDNAISNTLFRNSEPIELILQMDMQKVLNDKSEDPEYSPAFLIQKLGDNKIQTFNIKIKARGRTRRISDICEFPPLKLNFEKKSVDHTVFEGQDKIKMVTHCRESEEYQNYALMEYLAYKAYNTITDNSYRVRMVNVLYKDVKQKYPDIEKTGFFIEDDDLLAERIGGKITDKRIWSPDSCNQKTVDVFSLFQFMIGNTDWWIHTRHNVDIVKLKDNGLIPIPFDFDCAGMVNPPYAMPSPKLPIVHVKDRFFKGSCKTAVSYDETIKIYNLKKNAILSMLENSNYLDKKHKRLSQKYFEKFYEIINNPDEFSKYLLQTCELVGHPPGYASSK